ncbi:SEN15 endonuclease, partial [Centropus bengalensis]|nr:SEN15 endonuclease [Centropus bengalensis]
FTEMMSLFFFDSAFFYAAFLVFLDLLDFFFNWHEVKHVFFLELHFFCLHARHREQDRLFFLVPLFFHVSLSHEREILEKASLPLFFFDTPFFVTLAIVETDSTIFFFKITFFLVIPDPPDDTEDVDNEQWRKKRKKLFK